MENEESSLYQWVKSATRSAKPVTAGQAVAATLLIPECVYRLAESGRLESHRSTEPTGEELTALVETPGKRTGRYQTRRGCLTQDAENGYPADWLTEGGVVEE